MRLVPYNPEYLRTDQALPVGVRDAEGRLLLGAGHVLDNEARLQELRAQTLYADQFEVAEWNRRLTGAVDAKLREGAKLAQVAEARPQDDARAPARARPLTLPEAWREVVDHLDALLRDPRTAADWRARLMSVHLRARALADKRTDASLYLLIYEAAHTTRKYSSHHAALCMVISEEAARLLDWPRDEIDSLGRAAMLMNIGMTRLQDQLAADARPPNEAMKAEIAAHAERGAQLLEELGLADHLCLDTVRQHHDTAPAGEALATLPPAQRLARLLRRVDSLAAQISLRASRQPLSAVQAARDACLGPAGAPDEIGGALLRAVGLYPPGSFVQLDNGEIGLVLARGRRANTPYVAALVSAGGSVIAEPALRDTLDRRFAVKAAVAPAQVRVHPPHERLLAMR